MRARTDRPLSRASLTRERASRASHASCAYELSHEGAGTGPAVSASPSPWASAKASARVLARILSGVGLRGGPLSAMRLVNCSAMKASLVRILELAVDSILRCLTAAKTAMDASSGVRAR